MIYKIARIIYHQSLNSFLVFIIQFLCQFFPKRLLYNTVMIMLKKELLLNLQLIEMTTTLIIIVT